MIPADLSREELETLVPYRISDATILAAKADVARRKADRLRDEWRKASLHTRILAAAAKKIGDRDHWRGDDFAAAFSDMSCQRGRARDAEKLWKRAEKEALVFERRLRRARMSRAVGLDRSEGQE